MADEFTDVFSDTFGSSSSGSGRSGLDYQVAARYRVPPRWLRRGPGLPLGRIRRS